MDNNYILIINEESAVIHQKELSNDDLESASDGYLTILDISNPSKPLLLANDGSWSNL